MLEKVNIYPKKDCNSSTNANNTTSDITLNVPAGLTITDDSIDVYGKGNITTLKTWNDADTTSHYIESTIQVTTAGTGDAVGIFKTGSGILNHNALPPHSSVILSGSLYATPKNPFNKNAT